MVEKLFYVGKLGTSPSQEPSRVSGAAQLAPQGLYLAQDPNNLSRFTLAQIYNGSLYPLEHGRAHPVLARALFRRPNLYHNSGQPGIPEAVMKPFYEGMSLRRSLGHGNDKAGYGFVRHFVTEAEKSKLPIDHKRIANLVLVEISKTLRHLAAAIENGKTTPMTKNQLEDYQETSRTIKSYLLVLDEVCTKIEPTHYSGDTHAYKKYRERLSEKREQYQTTVTTLDEKLATLKSVALLETGSAELVNQNKNLTAIRSYDDFLVLAQAIRQSGGPRDVYMRQQRSEAIYAHAVAQAAERASGGAYTMTVINLEPGLISRYFIPTIEYRVDWNGQVMVVFDFGQGNTGLFSNTPYISIPLESDWMKQILQSFDVDSPEELAGREVYGVNLSGGDLRPQILGIDDLPDAQKTAHLLSRPKTQKTAITQVKSNQDGSANVYFELDGKKYGVLLPRTDESKFLNAAFGDISLPAGLSDVEVQSVTSQEDGDVILQVTYKDRRYGLQVSRAELARGFASGSSLEYLNHFSMGTASHEGNMLDIYLVDRTYQLPPRTIRVDKSTITHANGGNVSENELQNLINALNNHNDDDEKERPNIRVKSYKAGSEKGTVVITFTNDMQLTVKESDQAVILERKIANWLSDIVTKHLKFDYRQREIVIAGYFDKSDVKKLSVNHIDASDPVTVANLVGHEVTVTKPNTGFPFIIIPSMSSTTVSQTSSETTVEFDADGTPVFLGLSGRYVESEDPNLNGWYWPEEDPVKPKEPAFDWSEFSI